LKGLFDLLAEIQRSPSITRTEDKGFSGTNLSLIVCASYEIQRARVVFKVEINGPFMPVPVTARQGPTMVQQLDEILSSAHQIPVVCIDQPPNVDPFVYRPVERGQRARSESPGSFSLPPRPVTVPLAVPPIIYSAERPPRPSCHHIGRQETTSEEDIEPVFQGPPQQPPVSTQVPQEPQIDRVVQQPSQQQALC